MLRLNLSIIKRSFISILSDITINVHNQSIRESTTFFTRTTGEQLWKGVTSVSNAGRRRGRGKGASRKVAKDLNKGQILGIGNKHMLWPGLNAPILRGREIVTQRELPENKEYKERLIQLRDKMDKFSRGKVHILERGWSGTRMIGRWIGPPDPVNDEAFTGFDTKVLILKPIFCMKAAFGKTKRMSALTVTGNKNGLAGFAVGKARDGRTALRNSRNKSGQRLVYIPLDNGHTVVHDFYSKFGATEVFVRKKPKGYGLVAHRCIRSICEAIGITDLYCKVEGAEKNYLNLTRAFFLGLVYQKSFQEMADEKGLHIVEFREDRDNYPIVRASPSQRCRTDDEIGADESLDFNMYIYNGKVKREKSLKPLGYTKSIGWQYYLKKWHVTRSRPDVRVRLISKYGECESFLSIREREKKIAKRAAIISRKIQELKCVDSK